MLQKLINYIYRYPKAKAKEIRRYGGRAAYQSMLIDQNAMMRAAVNLEPIYTAKEGNELFFLTGKNYLYQTIFCIQSLSKNSSANYKVVLIDDGTFNEALVKLTKSILPNCYIVLSEEIESNLDLELPETKFPILRKKRLVYPHIKKLTDIHTLKDFSTNKLVLDSDMLFWKEPLELLDWFQNSNQSICMVDCNESYGYDKEFMSSLCGYPIPELVNVGIIGLKSHEINFADLEHWISKLEASQGPSYYLEQALTAILLARNDFIYLSKEKYIVKPYATPTSDSLDILHHYVDISKKVYFCESWKHFN